MPEQILREPPLVEGFVLVGREQIPIRRVALIGLISAPAWVAIFVGTARAFGGSSPMSFDVTVIGAIIAILNLTLVMPAVHEAIHGITAFLFGARPSYGVGAGFAYTTFRKPVRPFPYLVIGLAPLLMISFVGLVLLVFWPFAPGQTLVFLVGNGAGAFGDLWVTVKVLRLPSDSLICDLADGFAVYLPAEAQSAHP